MALLHAVREGWSRGAVRYAESHRCVVRMGGGINLTVYANVVVVGRMLALAMQRPIFLEFRMDGQPRLAINPRQVIYVEGRR